MGTETREEKGSFQRLVCEMKHVWMEDGEAEVASTIEITANEQ